MFLVDRARPFVDLVVDRGVGLTRRQKQAWRSTYVRECVTALLVEKYETETNVVLSVGADEEEESGLIKFLQWLIDHQAEIKAFIEMIMSLFNTEGKVDGVTNVL